MENVMCALNIHGSNKEKAEKMKTTKILLVDDDKDIILMYSRYFNKKGGQYITEYAHSIQEAKDLLANHHFDAMLLDVNLPDGNSIEHLPGMRELYENLAIIVVTGHNDTNTAITAIQSGADNFITKPIGMDQLFDSVNKALEIELIKKKATLQERIIKKDNAYFGESEVMKNIIHFSKVASMNDSVVLINGETGTGKGVLARWIHFNSSRKGHNFVELNCSALKGELLKSELFGHVKGAFTSAIKDREGLVEVADGGTLFLDEIGDMDLEVQAQLLKVIEEKSFRRLGDNKLRQSDFRLICATNVDLAKAVAEGRFRSDLYYRICVFPILLPSLRNRKEDIKGLVDYILANYGYKATLSQEVYNLLAEYPWPGNIRELKNMLERAILLAQGADITVAHFPGMGIGVIEKETQEPSVNENNDVFNLDLVEKQCVYKALAKFGADKSAAAKALGISLSSLYRKIEKYEKEPV